MTNCQEEIICIQKILESAREFVNSFYPKLIEARDFLQNLSIDIEGQTTTIRICGKMLKSIDENIVSEATVNKLAQVAVFEYLFYCFDTNENLKQSIDSFCKKKYVTKEHQKNTINPLKPLQQVQILTRKKAQQCDRQALTDQ